MAGNRRITRGLLLLIGGAILFFGACSNKLVTALFEKVSLAETDPPVPGDGGEINPDDVRAAAVTLSWEKATDEFVDQTALAYKVVYSTSDNIDTAAKAEKNGTVGIDWTADIASGDVAGLTIVTEYYFNVLVRDIAGNIGCYGGAEAKTIDDTKQPIPAGDIEISEVGTDGFTVSWEKAKDDEEVTPQDKLEYLVVYSTDDSEIQDAVEAEQYGTHAGTWEQDIDTKTITTMEDYVTYYVNVLVRDEVGNMKEYTESPPDRQTIKIPRFFWTQQVNEKVRAAVLSNNSTDLDIDTADNALPTGIAVDGEDRRIYWSDQNTKSIFSMEFNGTGVRTVIENIGQPYDILLSPEDDFLYWIDFSAKKIGKASRYTENGDASSGSFDLITSDGGYIPFSLAYDSDVTPNKIYWTEIGSTGRVRRADVDGSNIEDLRDLGSAAEPFGIALTNGWVYWTNTKPGSQSINKLTTSNTNFGTIINSGLDTPSGIAVTADNNEILWTDSGTDFIYRAPTSVSSGNGGTYQLSINTNSGTPTFIAIDE